MAIYLIPPLVLNRLSYHKANQSFNRPSFSSSVGIGSLYSGAHDYFRLSKSRVLRSDRARSAGQYLLGLYRCTVDLWLVTLDRDIDSDPTPKLYRLPIVRERNGTRYRETSNFDSILRRLCKLRLLFMESARHQDFKISSRINQRDNLQ